MASLTKTVSLYINNLASVTSLVGEVEFDISPSSSTGERFTLFPVVDAQEKLTFCDTNGGQALFQFDAYGESRYALYEKHNELMEIIREIRGNIGSSYNIWKVDVTGVRAFGSLVDNQYRYLFEATFYWSFS